MRVFDNYPRMSKKKHVGVIDFGDGILTIRVCNSKRSIPESRFTQFESELVGVFWACDKMKQSIGFGLDLMPNMRDCCVNFNHDTTIPI